MTARRDDGPSYGQLCAELDAIAYDVVLELAPGGRLHGAEYEAPSPFTNDGKWGKFSFNIRKCVWSDFRDATLRGDTMALVEKLLFDGDRAKAAAWAKQRLGYAVDGAAVDKAALLKRQAEARAAQAERDAQAQAKAEDARVAAARVWGMAAPLDGRDPGSAYLLGRGYDLSRAPRLRAPFRFTQLRHPYGAKDVRHPCLIAAVRKADKFLTIHRHYLMPDGKGGFVKLDAPDQRPGHEGARVPPKLAFSAVRGGAVWFPPVINWPPDEPDKSRKFPLPTEQVVLCEGADATALAIAMALEDPTKASWPWVGAVLSVSNLAAVDLPAGCAPIVYRDNDSAGGRADQGLTRSLTRLYERGHPPRLAAPPAGIKDADDLWNIEDDHDAETE